MNPLTNVKGFYNRGKFANKTEKKAQPEVRWGPGILDKGLRMMEELIL